MRSYYGKKVIVAGFLELGKVEMWTEHNHSQVYSNGVPLFDGYVCEANKKFNAEVKRICEIAEKHGQSFNVERI